MLLIDNVIFCSWQDNVGKWLEDKHYIISTSVHESFGYGIAEATACGLKPLIHNFFGAKNLYPQKYLFNTVQELTEMVLSGEYRPMEYREFIEKNYSLEKQMEQLEQIFKNVS